MARPYPLGTTTGAVLSVHRCWLTKTMHIFFCTVKRQVRVEGWGWRELSEKFKVRETCLGIESASCHFQDSDFPVWPRNNIWARISLFPTVLDKSLVGNPWGTHQLCHHARPQCAVWMHDVVSGSHGGHLYFPLQASIRDWKLCPRCRVQHPRSSSGRSLGDGAEHAPPSSLAAGFSSAGADPRWSHCLSRFWSCCSYTATLLSLSLWISSPTDNIFLDCIQLSLYTHRLKPSENKKIINK